MIEQIVYQILEEQTNVILKYKDRLPMNYISFWNGGESWTGHMLISTKDNFLKEEMLALFVFRTLCIYEEWSIDETYTDEHIVNMYNIAIAPYRVNNNIVRDFPVNEFLSGDYRLLLDTSKENLLLNRSYSELSINGNALTSEQLKDFDPLENYSIQQCLQISDLWNSQVFLLEAKSEYIYCEGWTNA